MLSRIMSDTGQVTRGVMVWLLLVSSGASLLPGTFPINRPTSIGRWQMTVLTMDLRVYNTVSPCINREVPSVPDQRLRPSPAAEPPRVMSRLNSLFSRLSSVVCWVALTQRYQRLDGGGGAGRDGGLRGVGGGGFFDRNCECRVIANVPA